VIVVPGSPAASRQGRRTELLLRSEPALQSLRALHDGGGIVVLEPWLYDT